MKKILGLLVVMLMVLSIVPLAFAEEEAAVVDLVSEDVDEEGDTDDEDETEEDDVSEEVSEEDEAEAGVTPDSMFWGLERAMERIDLALTFNKAAKAKKGLAHARERLLEAKLMIAAKKVAKAEKARERYNKIMGEVEENVEESGNGDAEGEIADQVEIEEKMKKNRMVLKSLIRLKVQGLSDEEKAKIKEAVENMEGVNSRFDAKIEAKREKARIKIKAEKGATDEEIDALVTALKEGRELAKVRIVRKGDGVLKEDAEQRREAVKERVEEKKEVRQEKIEELKERIEEKKQERAGDEEEAEEEVETEEETETEEPEEELEEETEEGEKKGKVGVQSSE